MGRLHPDTAWLYPGKARIRAWVARASTHSRAAIAISFSPIALSLPQPSPRGGKERRACETGGQLPFFLAPFFFFARTIHFIAKKKHDH